MNRVSHMPPWAQEQKTTPPLSFRLLGGALLLPLAFGAVAVHALGGVDDAPVDVEALVPGAGDVEYARTALSWSLHYAGTLLSFLGAAHWGFGLAEFGVPRKSDYMALYYLARFSAPVVFVFFGWLGSVLSTTEPQEAAMWLVCGYVGLMSYDFLATMFYLAPGWWVKWRGAMSLVAVACILMLMLSERNLYLGEKPMMRM